MEQRDGSGQTERRFAFRSPAGTRGNLYIKHEDGAVAHKAPHPVGTVDSFPEEQAAGEYSTDNQ